MKIRFESREESAERLERNREKRMELADLKRRMEMLFTFCPNYILSHDAYLIPKSPFVGVLLDIHITGLHRLMLKYSEVHEAGIYKFTYTLNAYLSAIVETVHFWKGDVIKNYGDKCLNLWEVSTNEALYEVLHSVVMCANIIRKAVRNIDTFVPKKLKMKISIACGNIYPTCHGAETKLMVFRGEPLEEVYQLNSHAKPGEILISGKAWAHMIADRYNVDIINSSTIKLLDDNISLNANERDDNNTSNKKEIEVLQLIDEHLEFMKTLQNHRQTDTNQTISIITNKFVERIFARKAITEAVRYGDLNAIPTFVIKRVQKHIFDHQPIEYLTELTTVTLQLILIIPNSRKCLTDALIRFVYAEVNKSIEGTNGFIYLFEVTSEIKVAVMTGIEGIRHDVHSMRALKSGYRMTRRFQNVPAVEGIAVGIFQDYLYCGVVGHPFRRDYVALGSVLSKGFKILSRHKGKVICDYKSFKFSKLAAFSFRCIHKRKCKLTFDTGQLVEYDERVTKGEEGCTQLQENKLFGRDEELDLIISILQSGASQSTQGVVFNGCLKIGKTAMLKFITNRISNSKSFIVISLSLLKATSAPFSAISHIYNQLYAWKRDNYKDIDSFFKLPTQLINRDSNTYDENEEITSKYRLLNVVKNLIQFESHRTLVILIRNIHYIDHLSWEVLEMVMDTCNLRLFGTADFTTENSKLKTQLQNNRHLILYTMPLLSNYWINTISCNFLRVAAIEKRVSALISSTCLGRPGYVQSCLTYFINCENNKIMYIPKNDLSEDFEPIHKELFDILADPIAVMSTKLNQDDNDDMVDKCTIASITKEYYFSLTPFDQAIVRTSSVLGTLFTRELLILSLHSPNEDALCKSIKTMFTEDIFECGSKYVNGNEINYDKFCCLCYMSSEALLTFSAENRYKHCKLLHFKHNGIRTIAYDMMPANQRKDLHLFCTEVLENNVHYCPACLRDPINSFVMAPKYIDILQYCSGPDIDVTACTADSSESLKECIRKIVYNPCQCNKTDSCKYVLPLRPTFDSLYCNCVEMLLFVYNNLIYHSNSAKHLGKQIFYHYMYGYLLILTGDSFKGVAMMRESYELCMVNFNSANCEISLNFRKFCIGRICMMMSAALIKMRKINEAKAHLILAMRQYNIPSVVFRYHHFQRLLKKSFLVNNKGRRRVILKQTWLRWEIGMCFILCARIFFIEGHLPIAKNCAKYSTWVLSQINERIPMLFEGYCNVIDLYRYGIEKDACEKLQKYVTKEILLNYCNDRGYYAKHLIDLLVVEFELKLCSGKLTESIHMCYRIIDKTLKFYIYVSNFDVIIWLSLMFTYTLRFKQFIDLVKVIHKNVPNDTRVWYLSNALHITLLTGYAYIPIEPLVKEILQILIDSRGNHTWALHYLSSLLCLHWAKSELFQAAEKCKPLCSFNMHNLKRPIAMRVMLNLIEADIMDIWHKMKSNTSSTRLRKTLEKNIKMVKVVIKEMPVFYPRLHCLIAWKYQLAGRTKKAEKELRIVEKISVEHDNLYFQCFVRKIRTSWERGLHTSNYKNREIVSLDDITFFSETQWAHVLIPYPI